MRTMTPSTERLANAIDLSACGGKAVNLARLIGLGVPVPDGFVIVNDALRHDVLDLDPVLPLLKRGAVIVRSSAIGEDSEDASFAGQLDTVGNVTGVEELRCAITRVWASQRSERVLAYQASRNKPLAGMGIVVQRQVASVLSGVLFSVSPTNAGEMLIEYCGGMGEALVSGAVNPGRIAVARSARARLHRWTQLAAPDEPATAESLLLNDVRIAEIARLALDIERAFGCPQDIEWAMDAAGQLWIVQARPITTPAFAPRASARPAVHGAPSTQQPAPSTQHPAPLRVWSNANVNENFPEPISPLLYSIARVGYYHYFRNLGRAFGISERRLRVMEPALRQIIGVHGARMYYNLTNIHACLRSAPFGDLLARSFNQFVGSEDTSTTPAGAGYRLAQASELAAIAAKTTWQSLFLTRRVDAFERAADAYARETHPDRLHDKSLADLLEDFRGFLEIRYHRWTNASLADAGSMVCYGLLQWLLARAFPGRDQQALHNSLLKALPDLVSGKPPLELWALSRTAREDHDLRVLFEHAPADVILEEVRTNPQFCVFRADLTRFLENWGFRCSAELMLTAPSFQEEPARVIELLKAYVTVQSESPADLLKRQEAERIAETRSVLASLRRRSLAQWLLVRTVLRWTQRSIQLRERARLKQALLYSRLRRLSLAIGDRLAAAGRLQRADDIFLLTADEVELLASGGEMFPDHVQPLVALRRDAHAAVSATTPPDSIELAQGEYYRSCSAGLQSCSPDDAGGRTEVLRYSDGCLNGVAACGGETTARAAILLDVTESHKLTAGDILVTRQTDPGWGPIFPLISGLVIERGGMLSHGAIIAREFGIPSVVGVKSATQLIPHGGLITVDGNRGQVHLGALRLAPAGARSGQAGGV